MRALTTLLVNLTMIEQRSGLLRAWVNVREYWSRDRTRYGISLGKSVS